MHVTLETGNSQSGHFPQFDQSPEYQTQAHLSNTFHGGVSLSSDTKLGKTHLLLQQIFIYFCYVNAVYIHFYINTIQKLFPETYNMLPPMEHVT